MGFLSLRATGFYSSDGNRNLPGQKPDGSEPVHPWYALIPIAYRSLRNPFLFSAGRGKFTKDKEEISLDISRYTNRAFFDKHIKTISHKAATIYRASLSPVHTHLDSCQLSIH